MSKHLKCRRSLLPSPVWPLPICLDSWTWHSRFLCNIALYSTRPCFYHSHIHSWILFLLWLHPFILSGVISPLISSSVLGTCWPGSSSFSILSFCLFILFMGFSRKEYWSGLPFPCLVDHILSDLSTMTCPYWDALWACLSFIELDKAVVLVWLDWLVFYEYAFSVSALWCPLATPTILLGFLLPWAWGISSRLLLNPSEFLLLLFRFGNFFFRRFLSK